MRNVPSASAACGLSTAAGRDDDRAVAVVHAALDAGVTFFDTADSYCSNESDIGHNERLIARALATWAGDRSRVIVATKGGLTRPDGQWVPDGRAKHLAAACEASCRALGVDRISLYQLHAPDPRVPFATSVRALDALKRDGRIEAIGLCNVNLRQLQEAREITEITAVQVELNPWQDANILSGVAGYCVLNGIRLVPYRPLGGPRRRRAIASDPLLSAIAVSHHATPHEVVLTWLAGLGEGLVPIPGPSRVETAASVGRAATIVLTDSERAQLDAHFPAAARLRRAKTPALVTAGAARDGEVVLVMGLPAAGKSTIARRFVERGYTRLNRDEIGGSLRAMVPALERQIVAGTTRLVLDNTYISRTSRAPIIEVATRFGLRTRGVWVATPVEDAQTNACWRMVEKYGRLLEPDEIRQTARRDAGIFGPGVHFRYERELEMPDPSEGFAAFEVVPFSRVLPPEFTERAVIVWCDGVLRRSRTGQRTPSSADDVEVEPGRGDRLREYQREAGG